MVTYLWTLGTDKYVGLNGHVYNTAPTTDEIVELQRFAQQYVNDFDGYGRVFGTNVASLIGEGADQFPKYYSTDDSCLPDICRVTAHLDVDEANPEPHVKSEIYTADTGCRVLDFTFYNIKGECECEIDPTQIFIKYTRGDWIDSNGCVDTVGHLRETSDGCDFMGIQISNNPDDQWDLCGYKWFRIKGEDAASSYVSYVFARSNELHGPEIPRGGTYATGLPDIPAGVWFDTVPAQNPNYGVWMSKRTFWSDEITPENPNGKIEHTDLAWSVPSLMTDTKVFQTEWAPDSPEARLTYANLNGQPNGYVLPSLNGYIDNNNYREGIDEEGWRAAASSCGTWSDNAVGATYMAWSNCRNGIWDAWTIAKIRGESGEDGVNAGRVFMVFCSLPKEDSNGVMPIPNRPADDSAKWDMDNNVLVPDEFPGSLKEGGDAGTSVTWSPNNTRQRSDMCTWLSTGSFDGVYGELIGHWSEPVCITGEDGIDGTDGENREYIYTRFETLDEYMCYASGTPYTEGFECGNLHGECMEMLATSGDPDYQTTSDYIPTNDAWRYKWLDHPEGIEPEWRVEACCVRVKRPVTSDTATEDEEQVMEWSEWYGPFIWASWGEDGIDGDGVEYIFCVTPTANLKCCYVEYTGDTEAISDWYKLDRLPSRCDSEDTEDIPGGGTECQDGDYVHEYVVIGEGDSARYYYKKSIFEFPYPMMYPPMCITDGIHCDTLDTASTAFTLYSTASNNDEREFLRAYYQLPEFIPGDKIKEDIADDDSPLMQLAKQFRPDASVSELRAWLNSDEFVKGWERNWTDNPLDVGPQQPYEWVCIRKYKYGTHDTTKEWQAFSEPKLWANWAFDGTSTFTSMVFTRTNDDIGGMVLCGGTFDIPLPGATEDGTNTCVSDDETTTIVYDPVTETSKATYLDREYIWEDTVPVSEEGKPNTDCIWMSMKIFGDEITNESQGWTAPVRMSDTADFNVEWCLDQLTQDQIDKIKSSEFNFTKYTEMFKDDPDEDELHSKAEAAWEQDLLTYGDVNPAFEGRGLGSWSDKGDGAIYMATTTFRNGKWTNWTVSKVKGEKGDSGTGLQMLGSTKGVSAFDLVRPPAAASAAMAEINSNTQDGDLWASIFCDGAECIDEGYVQFYQRSGNTWFALACQVECAYLQATESEFILNSATATTAEVRTLTALEPINENSPAFVHVSDTDVNDYYKLDCSVPKLNVGDTIVVNGVTESASSTQINSQGTPLTGDQLRSACGCQNALLCGIQNGDFFIWDGDSWTKTTNLLGPASYVHIKYADYFNGQYYRLTKPESIDPSNPDSGHGEVPGKYIGMYVDDVKQDKKGLPGNDDGPTPTVSTRYWSDKSGPYRWTQFQGEDGLGYEFIYTRTTSDTMSFPDFMGGRPFVPKFEQEFIDSATYQADDFEPSLANVPSSAWAQTSGYTTKPRTGDFAYDWTDDAISPDTQKRYRWKCYRIKEKGKWGQYIGDNSVNGGIYAAFDANCSDELLEADFSREFLPVFVDSNGKVAEEVTYTTEVFLKQAQKEFIITNVMWNSVDGVGVTANTGYVTCNGSSVSAITSLTICLTTACTAGDEGFTIDCEITGHECASLVEKTGRKSLTVVSMKTDVLYYIKPSVSAIKYDGAGNLVTTAVTCGILKKVIGVDEMVEIEYNSIVPFLRSERLSLSWYPDGKTTQEIDFGSSLETPQIRGANTSIDICLRNADTGTLYANEQLLVYKDGASMIKADLDNEQDAIPLTYEGAVDGVLLTHILKQGNNYAIVDANAVPTSATAGVNYFPCVSVSTNVSLFYGTKKTGIGGLSATTTTNEAQGAAVPVMNPPTQMPVTPILLEGNSAKVFVSCVNSEIDTTDGTSVLEKAVTVYILNGWSNYPETLRVQLNVKCALDNQIYNNTFSIAGVRAGSPGEHATIFNLLPESSFIVKHADGSKTPPNLYCFIQKRTGIESFEYNVNYNIDEFLAQNHMKIIYSKDNSDAWFRYDVYNGVQTGGEEGVGTCVTFELVDENNVDGLHPIDREKVPVVADGEPGRGIVATCRYYTLSQYNKSADFSENVLANYPIPDYGQAPNKWVMIGSYVPSEGSSQVVIAEGTIPETSIEEGQDNMYLWMVEVTWYTNGTPKVYKTQPMMLSKDGVGIKACKNYYKSAYTETYETVLSYYMTLSNINNTDDPTSSPYNFTETMPTGDLDVGYTIWYFTAIYYTDGTRAFLPLCVFKDGTMLKDIEVLRGMFGEANVEGKQGAYLREFLGVMGDWDFKPGGASDTSENFVDRNVKAFLNASPYWAETRSGEEYLDPNGKEKGRIMIAAGVTNLGGRKNITTPPFTGSNTDTICDIENFVATTKIWESGFLECTCASVEGRIEATEGYFGGAKNIVVAEDGIVAYPIITLSNGKKAADYTATPMFIIGETGATFNGTVNANAGTIGCLVIDSAGTISHKLNENSHKVFELTPEGQFTVTYTHSVGNNQTTNVLSNGYVSYYEFTPPVTNESLLKPGFFKLLYEDSSMQRNNRNTILQPGTAKFDASQGGTTDILGGGITCDTVYATMVSSVTMYASTGFYQTSDARKKDNIMPLTNVLDTIESVPTVYYNWKEGDTKARHIGTLAQGLLPLYPEVVSGTEDTSYTVEYSELSVIAIAAIKELKKEVMELKDEIKRLKDERK